MRKQKDVIRFNRNLNIGIRFTMTTNHNLITSIICLLLTGTSWLLPQSTINSIFKLSGKDNITFDRLTVEDGLPHGYVNVIIQDSQGFMWFGTQSGLSRYDGYYYKNYYHNSNNSNSLSDNKIWALYEDLDNNLWIGTQNGLNKFDLLTETFTRFYHDPQDPYSLSNNEIRAIYQDKSGTFWIGTTDGLNRRIDFRDSEEHQDARGLTSTDKLSFKRYLSDPDAASTIRNGFINVIYEDRFDILWIGTGHYDIQWGGLHQYNKENETFNYYTHDTNDPKSLSNDWVTAIHEDSKGNLWIGTNGGLNKFDRQTETFSVHRGDYQDSYSISNDWVKCVWEDDDNNIWFGTWEGGINKLDPVTNNITDYTYDPLNAKSLSHNVVYSIYEDRSGIFWLGTWGGGVNKFKPTGSPFSNYIRFGQGPGSSFINEVTCIYEDQSRQYLWIGTKIDLTLFDRRKQSGKVLLQRETVYAINQDTSGTIWVGGENGIFTFDGNGNPRHQYLEDSADQHGLSTRGVNSIFLDSKKAVWVGAAKALNKFDPETNTFRQFQYDPLIPQNPKNDIHAIHEDKSGAFWLATLDGLNKFDPQTATFTHYRSDSGQLPGLIDNNVETLLRDKSGALWVGTNNGLSKMVLTDGTASFTNYTTADGLPGNIIGGILEDGSGNLWISTNYGLCVFNPQENRFKVYYKEDGLPANMFNARANFQNAAGVMFFGGNNGFMVFHPDSIIKKSHIAPVVLTGFKKFNNTVYLDTAIAKIQAIRLPYDENVFSLEFASLDYTNPEKNQYAYKLEGFSEDWINIGNKRDATFTNLDPGAYTFRVKGSNYDGIWNESGASLRILITPPWWQTWWAYLLYFFLAGAILYSLRRYDLHRQRLKHQLEMELAHSEQLQEIDRMKSRFFANISHEFRTPLTLILGPLENWIKDRNIEQSLKPQFRMMHNNATRLRQLINQLLELAKLEAGAIKLQAANGDIAQLLLRIFTTFSSLAERKQITLQFNNVPLANSSGLSAIHIYFDREKLEQVFYNLLSNAFKFTPEGGKISLTVAVGSDNDKLLPEKRSIAEFIEIRITNTGPGIPADKLPNIFDRFYQADDDNTRTHEGTGIGLALVKELVELHHGAVGATSIVDEATTFTVLLPMGKKHLQSDEIIAPADQPTQHLSSTTFMPESTESASMQNNGPQQTDATADATLILIVEDHADLRTFIRENLPAEYRVIEAENGKVGLEKAKEAIPDLVISDVMMPEMDGYQLCEALKRNMKTNHIPVVLLTARAAREKKIAGLEFGADDYLTKPFDPEELQIRVRNLINIRQQMREKFSKEMRLGPAEVTVPSTQKAFLERLNAVLEQFIEDENFNVEALGSEIGMSRGQLHRKLKALINQSPSEFIRNFRLQRAADLIRQDAGNMAEIAYMVGFNSQAYFTRSFQDLFGCTPSEYRRTKNE